MIWSILGKVKKDPMILKFLVLLLARRQELCDICKVHVNEFVIDDSFGLEVELTLCSIRTLNYFPRTFILVSIFY